MHRHAEDDGVKIVAEEGHEGGIRCLEVMAETRTLLRRKRKLDGAAFIQRLAEVEELLGGNSHHTVGTACGLYVTTAKCLLVMNDKGQESREIAVLDRWYKGFVLAECAGEEYGELRARDRRSVVRTVTRDWLMLRRFTQGGVVVRHGRTPHIGDDLSLSLIDIPAAVLTLELFVESRVRRVTGNNERQGFVYFADQLQG